MWPDKNVGDTALLFLHGHDVDTKMYIYIDVQHLYSMKYSTLNIDASFASGLTRIYSTITASV